MIVGVISDTHDLLRQEVINNLKNCEIILHAGDVCNQTILERLQQIAPTIVVRGNNDKKLPENIPKVVSGELEGIRYTMVHDKRDIPKDTQGVDLIIFGHSHKYYEECLKGVYYLNPGSCGKSRFSLPLTMAIIEVVNREITINKISIS